MIFITPLFEGFFCTTNTPPGKLIDMQDKVVARLIQDEAQREQNTLNLIASENYVSRDVREALGSVFTNKYAEGYPGKRYYSGTRFADAMERECQSRALTLFGLSEKKWHVNVQPYSGSPANLAVYLALVPPGEKIMGLRLDMGGHLTHGHKVSASGILWKQVAYEVERDTARLDYDAIARAAKKEKPKLVVAGFSAHSRKVDFKKFRAIADAAGAYLMADISHIAGLVAAGAHPSPFPYADVVTTTTHKTLRGPRAALIFSKLNVKCHKSDVLIDQAIDKAVFPGVQGGPHLSQIAASAVALKEATSPAFKRYAKQIVANARILAEELALRGWHIVSGGTDTHLLLVDVSAKGMSGKEAEALLEQNGVTVNKNAIPHDTRSPFDPSGIRLGTAALTTRGMGEREMKIIAEIINAALVEKKNVKKEVATLCKKFPIPQS